MQLAAFSRQLKALRLRHNWTQAFVAEQIGTTTVNVSRWERGILAPSLYFRQKLCDFFEVSVDELGILLCYASKTEDQPSKQEHLESTESTLSFCWLPGLRNVLFTGRDEIIEHLFNYFFPAVNSAHTRIQVLCGMGGIGKTQTALEFAYRYRHNYTALFWIHAESRETIEADVASIVDLLGLTEGQSGSGVRGAFRYWLETHTGWLLVLDNLMDFHTLEKLALSNSSGHILLTTRSQVTGTLTRSLDLQKMTPDEGALFLLRRAKLLSPQASLSEYDTTLTHEAYAIVRLMDGLPLALDQVGAYLEETGGSLADYLVIHAHQPAMLLQRRGQFATGHPASLTATILQAYERVRLVSPLAADFLCLLAFLDEGMFSEELALLAIDQFVTHTSWQVSRSMNAKMVLYEIIAILRRYSLVSFQASAYRLRLHPLVREVLKNALDEQRRFEWTQRALLCRNSLSAGHVFVDHPQLDSVKGNTFFGGSRDGGMEERRESEQATRKGEAREMSSRALQGSWQAQATELCAVVAQWRASHPQATMVELEQAMDEQINRRHAWII